MKPPAPVSGEISVEIARMPLGRIAAMKPEPSPFTSLVSRTGSPAISGERAIVPVMSLIASARSLRLMKFALVAPAGQVCHFRSSAVTVWPSPMSDLAISTSVVSIWGTGAAVCTGGGFEPLAR